MPTTARYWPPDALSRDALLALTASAGRLSRAAADGTGLPQLLRGKRLALLSDDHSNPAAAAFRRAATELGAHVAFVRNGGPQESGPRSRAALLGQLYDAIECQGLSEAELRQLSREAGVPVFDGIGSPDHPLYAVADQMTQQELGGTPDAATTAQAAALQARNRHHLLQALLCSVLT
jgi:ornithine carbamoyltransferase